MFDTQKLYVEALRIRLSPYYPHNSLSVIYQDFNQEYEEETGGDLYPIQPGWRIICKNDLAQPSLWSRLRGSVLNNDRMVAVIANDEWNVVHKCVGKLKIQTCGAAFKALIEEIFTPYSAQQQLELCVDTRL